MGWVIEMEGHIVPLVWEPTNDTVQGAGLCSHMHAHSTASTLIYLFTFFTSTWFLAMSTISVCHYIWQAGYGAQGASGGSTTQSIPRPPREAGQNLRVGSSTDA